jgi:hypothetical protein
MTRELSRQAEITQAIFMFVIETPAMSGDGASDSA